MREVVKSDWFARVDLILVIVSGVAWLFVPDYTGALPLLLLLLPWGLRLFAGEFPFRRTPFDGLMAVFLITAWVGCWASYNQADALNKAWLITTSVFLYYALSAQPEKNLLPITSGLFLIGVGISVYFFLTYDFVGAPRKIEALSRIGVWWANIRPQFRLPLIHPNYISGIVALTAVFGLHPLQRSRRGSLLRAGMLAGFFVVLSALVMATSRGIWMALVGAAGLWLLWRIVNLNGIKPRLWKDAFFPILVLVYLGLAVVFLYIGPANSPSSIIGSSDFGTGSRAELFERSLYFLIDFPIIGGGLGAFPGLYSRYILDIPYFYVVNSHNLFLDVFIEQGWFGGAAFFLIYISCIWRASAAIMRKKSSDMLWFAWLTMIALVIVLVHGMVDDYLYNGKGAVLSLLLAGISMVVTRDGSRGQFVDKPASITGVWVSWRWYTVFLLAGFVVVAGINLDRLRAVWYANLGAVQMAKIELANFPKAGWFGPVMADRLKQADASLHTALELDPRNRTASHRLGLISMMRRDFSSAVIYLNMAHVDVPYHRGIIKSLGFGYAWLGDMNNAVSLLKNIPETKNELDAYYSWWQEQGRGDLSEKAIILRRTLDTLSVQP